MVEAVPPSLDPVEVILRVLAAAVLGGAVGFEREYSGQPAGLRTHLLVALGSAAFTIVGAYGLQDFAGEQFRIDPTRIAAQVLTGIGFIGAGAIIQQGVTVRGITTAASLWVTGAIGVAAGFGYWVVAGISALVAVVALYALKLLERAMFGKSKTEGT